MISDMHRQGGLENLGLSTFDWAEFIAMMLSAETLIATARSIK